MLTYTPLTPQSHPPHTASEDCPFLVMLASVSALQVPSPRRPAQTWPTPSLLPPHTLQGPGPALVVTVVAVGPTEDKLLKPCALPMHSLRICPSQGNGGGWSHFASRPGCIVLKLWTRLWPVPEAVVYLLQYTLAQNQFKLEPQGWQCVSSPSRGQHHSKVTPALPWAGAGSGFDCRPHSPRKLLRGQDREVPHNLLLLHF